MRKARNLIGMPVIVDHRRIGRIVRIDLTDDWSFLSGIWVDAGLRGTRFIATENLCTLGEIAVIADNVGKRKRMGGNESLHRAIGTDGQRLGVISGMEIDELSFHVEALELSFGLWDDLIRGRKRIEQFHLNRTTGDVLIAAETKKEADKDEEWNDEGLDYRRAHRRLGSGHVRHHELADCTTDEHTNEKDRSLDFFQGQ